MNVETVRLWLRLAAESMASQRDYLTQLDAAIGDADHGTNMDRGFSAVASQLVEAEAGESPGQLLVEIGTTLFSAVGGASGALWGIALQRAGRALGDVATVDGAALAGALEEALAGMVELGAAEEGDKTMVDALAPATRSFRESVDAGKPLPDALGDMRGASEQGMRATIPLRAAKGRASYLGERSVGHQDPGATSTMLILAALERAVSDS